MNHGFKNDNTIMHNNLYPMMMTEEIKEYSVLIDSKDRNYQVFPNPFHYDVTFNPLHMTRERVKGKLVTHETPNPTINQGFENVRYIKLENAILPTHIKTKLVTRKLPELNEVGLDDYVTEEFIDTDYSLHENLYTVLMIDEYKNVNIKSTNDILSDSFATIYPHNIMGGNHFRTEVYNAVKIFPPDNLGKIDKFRIRFLDPYGCELNCDHLDPGIKTGMVCRCDDLGDDEERKRGTASFGSTPRVADEEKCFKHNINHPLNPLFQHHLHFKVGVVEQYMNKKVVS